MAENREVIIWFGKGGDGPSRQRVKTPRKRFLKYLKARFPTLKDGDEYYTSAKVKCCKVFHEDLYFIENGERKKSKAYFVCSECGIVWSRDISASRNQWKIAVSEYFLNTRPLAFRRPQ
ncbi:hypothetical protein P9112_007579 [Eukaryota sp. TZLM1-RC]